MKLIIDIPEEDLTEDEVQECIEVAKSNFSDVKIVQDDDSEAEKKDALEEIRDEIANEKGTFPKEHYIRIIDKYRKESIDEVN